jgi:sensory rhodopsin
MAIDSVFFWAGAAVMALGTATFLWAFVTDARNRTYHAVLVGIAGVAVVSYTLMSLRVGTVTVDGRIVDVPRYFQWILGTPLIVLYLGLLAGVSRRTVAGLVVVDVAVMTAGLVGAMTTGTVQLAAFVVGSVLYLPLIYGLVSSVKSAVSDRPSAVRELFAKLRNLTVVIWTFYPVAYFLGPTGVELITYEVEVLVITYADVIAKVGFGLIALNSQRALGSLPELDALRVRGGGAGSD